MIFSSGLQFAIVKATKTAGNCCAVHAVEQIVKIDLDIAHCLAFTKFGAFTLSRIKYIFKPK